jgi:acyl carrier protein
MGLQVSKLDIQQPLSSAGIDSLMAVELKNRIEADFGVILPLAKFLQGPSVVQLAKKVLGQLEQLDFSPSPSPAQEGPPAFGRPEESKELMTKIDELSESEVDALLKKILTSEEDNE